MKTVGIFIGPCYMKWDENTVKNGMGGSETWAHEVASRLSQKGYDVTMYAYPEEDHDPLPNYHLVSHERYLDDIKTKRFDYFIYSRYTGAISPYLKCDNVYVMIHDVCMVTPENIPSFIGLGRVKKYCYLSEWHKENLLGLYSQYGLSENMLYKVTNGYSTEYYNDIDLNNKTNSMVWSSSLLRGFDIFYESVFLPLIKKHRDLRLIVCTGTLQDVDKFLLTNSKMLPGVEICEKLSKEKLAEVQKSAKFWVYPGIFPETFCITAVENAAAGNVIISPLSYGLSTTLNKIDYLKEADLEIMDNNNAESYIKIVDNILTDDELRLKYANECMKQASEYNWDRATEDFIKLFNEE